jgi:predicted dehydrogenase
MLNRRAFLSTTSAGLMALAGSAGAQQRSRTPIRIGQIGVGHAHATKLAVYRASPDYEVVGIVEPDAELRRKAEAMPVYQGLPWMSQEQLLNVDGLRAVLIETRVRDLLDAAEAGVNAGKHVHLDKPAGTSLRQYRRILDHAEKQGLLVQMGYMYRYNPAMVLLRKFLAEGWLGEVFEVHAVMSKVVGAAERKQLAQFSGGIMFELGCHVIDQVVKILGKPESVAAHPRRSSRSADDGLWDNMLAVFHYDRATATVKSSAIEVDGGERRHLVVCGTEGTFHIQPLDNPKARLTLTKPRGEFKKGYQDVTFPKYTRYVDDAADMARIIRGEKASDFSYEHDFAVQQTVLSASGMSDDA